MKNVLGSEDGNDSTGGAQARRHSARARTAIFAGGVLACLVFVAPALAVTVTGYTPVDGTAQLVPYCDGTPIIVTGSGFITDGGTVTVKFNGVTANFVQVTSDNTLSTVVPANATSGPITVTTAAGTASSAGISAHGTGINDLGPGVFVVSGCEYATAGARNPVPASISAVSPSTGKAGTKVTIKITGTLVNDVTQVRIGGAAAAHSVVSETKIIATVPKKAKAGVVSVTVITADGSVIKYTKFRVTK
jgi:hypothetical protein